MSEKTMPPELRSGGIVFSEFIYPQAPG